MRAIVAIEAIFGMPLSEVKARTFYVSVLLALLTVFAVLIAFTTAAGK